MKVYISLSPELNGERASIEYEVCPGMEMDDVMTTVSQLLNVVDRGNLIKENKLCLRPTNKKKGLSIQELTDPNYLSTIGSSLLMATDLSFIVKTYVIQLKDEKQSKKAIFMIKKELTDDDFAKEFLSQGGLKVILMQIMDFSGSVLAYALSALEKAMTYNTGWEVISEQHLEKIMELIEGWDEKGSAGKTNVINCALKIGILLAKRQTDSPNECWGYAAINRAVLKLSDSTKRTPYHGLVSCIGSTELNMQLGALTMINNLLRSIKDPSMRKAILENLQKLSIDRTIHWQIHIENEEFRRQIYLYQMIRLDEHEKLRKELYDKTNPSHEELLMRLWKAVFPEEILQSRVSEQWKKMGFQGTDPATDFRGMGLLGLMNLIYIAENHSKIFRRIVNEQASRDESGYPTAVTGISISQLLVQMFHVGEILESGSGKIFNILFDHPHAFEEIYTIVFQLLDRIWDEMKATYMDFPKVITSTKEKVLEVLERSDSISSFERGCTKSSSVAPLSSLQSNSLMGSNKLMSMQPGTSALPKSRSESMSINMIAVPGMPPVQVTSSVFKSLARTIRDETLKVVTERRMTTLKQGATFRELPKKGKHEKEKVGISGGGGSGSGSGSGGGGGGGGGGGSGASGFIRIRSSNDLRVLHWAYCESAESIPEALDNSWQIEEITSIAFGSNTQNLKKKLDDESINNSFSISFKDGTVVELVASSRADCVAFTDAIRKLVNPMAEIESPESLNEIDILSTAVMSVRLINLDGLTLPDDSPEIPPPPPHFEFVMKDANECENIDHSLISKQKPSVDIK